jgi:hypothetical protein
MKRLAIAAAAIAAMALSPAALAAGTLSGKYNVEIKNDLALGGALNGTWVIKFKPAVGKYHITDDTNLVVNGKYTISGNKISFKDTGGPGTCPTTGKYKFKLSGIQLTFTKISESKSAACIGRQDLLVGHTFTKG